MQIKSQVKMQNSCYTIDVPLKNQAQFTFVAVFRESVEFIRDYTLPFDMISIASRCKNEESSVITNLLNGEVIKSHLNDLLLIPSGLPQRYWHTYGHEHLCIHFKLELYPGVDVFSGQQRTFLFNSKEITQEAIRIFSIQDDILKLSHCQELALRICHKFWPEEYPFDLKRMRKFDEVLAYIREFATALTTVEDLAKIRHCSTGTFTREFHDVFKISPKLFLEKELFRQAALSLMDPESSVKTVASKLGFSTEFYFSRFFKRMSGIPPKDYHKSVRK